MSDLLWAEVDEYIAGQLLGDDPILDAALERNLSNGLPPIDVSPAYGKFLNLLARISGARRILEIGTLGGYSTICLARALPSDGTLITLEYKPEHAEVARQNLDQAGLSDRVEIRLGVAKDSLAAMAAEPPFDLIFIDADKENNALYVREAVRLGRPGTVVIIDNVARAGAVVDAQTTDSMVMGVREMFDLLQREGLLDATALQTVGVKGWDGFLIGLVR